MRAVSNPLREMLFCDDTADGRSLVRTPLTAVVPSGKDCILSSMPSDVDLVYDRLIANEKLKAGSKYERLGAVVFRHLTGQTTVHDLRLRGDTGVPHQIDAVVGDERKRVLIEAKDYDRMVDLP